MCAFCDLVNTITAKVCALDIPVLKILFSWNLGLLDVHILQLEMAWNTPNALAKQTNFCFPPLLFVLLRWAHLQERCLLKTRTGRMSLLHHGDWACGKPAVTEHWQKSAQLKRHKKRKTQPGWCARPLLLASHPHWTIRTRKRSEIYKFILLSCFLIWRFSSHNVSWHVLLIYLHRRRRRHAWRMLHQPSRGDTLAHQTLTRRKTGTWTHDLLYICVSTLCCTMSCCSLRITSWSVACFCGLRSTFVLYVRKILLKMVR